MAVTTSDARTTTSTTEVVRRQLEGGRTDVAGLVFQGLLLFSLIGFGTLFGTLGVILAAPLAVVSLVMVKRLYVIETLDTATPIPGEAKS